MMGNPQDKKSTGRPKRLWNDNIRTDLSEMDYEMWTWFNWFKIQSLIVEFCEYSDELSGSIKYGP